MKNKEFYKDKIFDAACKYKNLAVDKETGEICKCHINLCKDCALLELMVGSCTDAWELWLEQEHIEPVLDDVEKRYLEAVLMPFKNRVLYVAKVIFTNSDKAFLEIRIKSFFGENDREGIFLPYFHPKKMYVGMEENRRYTIEELGLFE